MHFGFSPRASSWVSRSSSDDRPFEYAEEVRFDTADWSVRGMCSALAKKGQQSSARRRCESLMFRENGKKMSEAARSQ